MTNIKPPKVSLRATSIYYAVFFFISVVGLTNMLIATIQVINKGGLDRLPLFGFLSGMFLVFSTVFWFWMIGALKKLNAANPHKED